MSRRRRKALFTKKPSRIKCSTRKCVLFPKLPKRRRLSVLIKIKRYFWIRHIEVIGGMSASEGKFCNRKRTETVCELYKKTQSFGVKRPRFARAGRRYIAWCVFIFWEARLNRTYKTLH